MQLLEILEGLTPAEVKKLEQQLKEGNRPQSYQLFRELKKYIGDARDYNREAVFKKVFGKTYAPSNKYLLANETRQLKTTLNDFLVREEIAQELIDSSHLYNKWLTQAWARRKMFDPIDREMDKFIEDAVAKNDYVAELELLQVKRDFLENYNTRPNRSLSPSAGLDFLNSLQKKLIRNLLLELRSLDIYRAYLEDKDNFEKGHPRQPIQMIKAIEFDDYINDVILLRELFATAYGQVKEDRLETLFHCVQLLDKLGDKADLPLIDQVRIRSWITTTIMELRRYEEARDYIAKRMERIPDEEKPLDLTLMLNYLLALLLTGEYKEVIDYYLANREEADKSVHRISIEYVVVFAYLFLEQTKEALDFLNASAAFNKRLCYVIIHIIDKEWDMAERELTNYTRSKLIAGVRYEIKKLEAASYKRYIQLMLLPVDEQKQQLPALLAELEATYAKRDRYELPFEWLINKIKQQVNTVNT